MKAISILISAALITSASAQNDENFLKETKLPDNEAVEFVNRLGLGWNLGNQMDAVNNGAGPSATKVSVSSITLTVLSSATVQRQPSRL